MFNLLKLWLGSIFYLLFKIPKMISIRFTRDEIQKRDKSFLFINNYASFILKILNIKISIENEEYLKKLLLDENVIFISNHSSILDPFFIFKYLKSPTSFFVAGEYNYIEKIPFVGTLIKEMNNIFVNRENIREGVRSISKAQKVLKNNMNVFIFPEGEISHRLTREKMASFKPGPFSLALRSKKTIVPITICGGEKIQFKVSLFGKINSGSVSIYINNKIPYENIKSLSSVELAEYTHNIILKKLKEC